MHYQVEVYRVGGQHPCFVPNATSCFIPRPVHRRGERTQPPDNEILGQFCPHRVSLALTHLGSTRPKGWKLQMLAPVCPTRTVQPTASLAGMPFPLILSQPITRSQMSQDPHSSLTQAFNNHPCSLVCPAPVWKLEIQGCCRHVPHPPATHCKKTKFQA
jgi:hypothetical protein